MPPSHQQPPPTAASPATQPTLISGSPLTPLPSAYLSTSSNAAGSTQDYDIDMDDVNHSVSNIHRR